MKTLINKKEPGSSKLCCGLEAFRLLPLVQVNCTKDFKVIKQNEAKHLQLSPEDELLVTNFLEEKQKRKEQTEDNEPERER